MIPVGIVHCLYPAADIGAGYRFSEAAWLKRLPQKVVQIGAVKPYFCHEIALLFIDYGTSISQMVFVQQCCLVR